MEQKKTWSNIVANKDSSFPTPPSHSPSPPLVSNISNKMESLEPSINLERKYANNSNSLGFSWPIGKQQQTLSEERSPLSVPPGLDSNESTHIGWKTSKMMSNAPLTSSPQILKTHSESSAVHWDWNIHASKTFWNYHQTEELIPRPKSGLGLPTFDSSNLLSRQNRSMSVSLGQPLKLDLNASSHSPEAFTSKIATAPVLSALESLEEDSIYEEAKSRSRSKSFSAIYAFGSNEEDEEYEHIKNVISPNNQDIWNIEEDMSLSGSSSSSLNAHPHLYHRRASTQPSGGLFWESHPFDPTFESGQVMLNAEQLEKYKQQRRFSHAPTLYKEYSKRLAIHRAPGAPSTLGQNGYDASQIRRHSVAPSSNLEQLPRLTEELHRLGLDKKPAVLNEINDYFENTENRARARAEAGKALMHANHHSPTTDLEDSSNSENQISLSSNISWPLYVVEFKAGRTDFFYVPSELKHVKKGDIVIVEADRGKDLGKVIEDNITSMNVLQRYQALQMELLPEAHGNMKSIVPKRIYRMAESSEITLLFSKNQDEAKAMSICQARIRQKNLPMEIVDAEYQWDRRKLTFYFVSDRRIDFRELVRELFKIYKTRIWMCAVNVNSMSVNDKL